MVTVEGEYEVPVDDGDVENALGSFPVPREV